jgi:hypothetical protein
MNESIRKKWYLWQLARFLYSHKMKMSGDELAEHLNRNGFRTGDDQEYSGKRGTYTLITAAWKWVHDDLGLKEEAAAIALAFVKPDGSPAWRPTHLTSKEAVYAALKERGNEHQVSTAGGQYVFLFDPEEQSAKGSSCAILYEFKHAKAPVHLNHQVMSGERLKLLEPLLRSDSTHSPDSHGWHHYEVADWAGFANALELV